MEYSGKSNAALTTGIIGTTLGGLLTLNGGLSNGNGIGLFGGNNVNMVDSRYVSRDDLNMAIALAQKDSEIALLKSEQNTEVKIADVYARIKGDLLTLERSQADWNAAQSVANAQMSSAIATNANSISAIQTVLGNITQVKVPNNAVCPGWGEVTVTPA